MSTAWETFPLKFEGGWRTDLGRLEQGLQSPGSATVLKNFEPSVTGGYQKILGYSKFDDEDVDELESGNVLGVIVVDETKAIARKGDNYYTSEGSGWTEVLATVTTGGTRIHFDFYNFDGNDTIVVVDGVEDPAFYDITGGTMAFDAAAHADASGASLVKVFKNHLFFAKNNLLTFTAPWTDNDYTPANGSGQINVGATITGLIVFRDRLIVFTRDSILNIQGNTSDDFVMQPITDKTGCLCPYTVQEVGGDILYLGPDGIRWLSATERNEDFGLERASAKIQDVITRLISADCNYTTFPIRGKSQYRIFNYQEAALKKFSEGYIATLYSDQSTSRIDWSQIVGMKVYSAHSLQLRDREIVLFTSEDGFVYRMEDGNSFDGTDIECTFETPYIPINDPRIRKTLYKHSLYFKAFGTIDLSISIKFDYNVSGSIQPPTFIKSGGGGTGVYGEAVYGVSTYATAVSDTFIDPVYGSGFVASFKYASTDSNPPFVLDYAIIEYMNNERR